MESQMVVPLDLTQNPAEIAYDLINIPSVSHDEKQIADAIEQAWRAQCPHLKVYREGNSLAAATFNSRPYRVIIAGHIDTVPFERGETWPARWEKEGEEELLCGRGSVDMKSGLACFLKLSTESDSLYDVTYVAYECEEVAGKYSGLAAMMRAQPQLFAGADFGILCEPTSGRIEAGCNGTLRVLVTTKGKVAHSARAWRGKNAIHAAGEVLTRLDKYRPEVVGIERLGYRESLSATMISGGVATNSVPDACTITINYRFAPTKTPQEALAHLKQVLRGLDLDWQVDDMCAGAMPGLGGKLGQRLIKLAGNQVDPKYGWTDVARLSAAGIGAINYGPGDPLDCHSRTESCKVSQIDEVYRNLRRFLFNR